MAMFLKIGCSGDNYSSLHCAPAELRSPGFPVEIRGFDGLHAALFTESRTRGRRQQREVGNPGRDDKERVVAYLGSCDWDVWISGGRVVSWTGKSTLLRLK